MVVVVGGNTLALKYKYSTCMGALFFLNKKHNQISNSGAKNTVVVVEN